MHTPYTYLIGWTSTNTWYYGVRYSRKCCPSELWVSYFTSSKYVTEHTKLYGAPDVLQIRKTFSSISSARQWEHTVLRRLRSAYRHDFLNKTDNKSIAPMPGVKRPGIGGVKKGTTCPIKGKKAYYSSDSGHLTYLAQDEIPLLGYVKGAPPKTTEHNLKNSKSNLGRKKHSNEQRLRWSSERKGCNTYGSNSRAKLINIDGTVYTSLKEACKVLEKDINHIRYYLKHGEFKQMHKTCEYCSKRISNANYSRWHGLLCKSLL